MIHSKVLITINPSLKFQAFETDLRAFILFVFIDER